MGHSRKREKKCGETMNISIDKLLAKMEAELQGARTAETNAEVREKVHSLKTLCELLLDEPVRTEKQAVPRQPDIPPQIFHAPLESMPVQPQPVYHSQPAGTQGKRMQIDSDANGESLLDF